MSMPEFKKSCVSKEQAINDLLESIALEEAGLAHIINAEGEKIQYFVNEEKRGKYCIRPEEIIEANQSVSDLLTKVIKLQMLLEFKLDKVAELVDDKRPPRASEDGCEE